MFDGYSLIKLTKDTIIKPFDCGDDDLNDFLINKAKKYYSEHLATTFIIEDANITVAYYSILNDSLRIENEKFASKTKFKRFLKNLVSHSKRHLKYYPAVKIGRLAVNKDVQNTGLGKIIINNIIKYSIEINEKCACKLITVDAYSKSLAFYEKSGFEYLTEMDKDNTERQMFLDLTPIIKAFEEQQ